MFKISKTLPNQKNIKYCDENKKSHAVKRIPLFNSGGEQNALKKPGHNTPAFDVTEIFINSAEPPTRRLKNIRLSARGKAFPGR